MTTARPEGSFSRQFSISSGFRRIAPAIIRLSSANAALRRTSMMTGAAAVPIARLAGTYLAERSPPPATGWWVRRKSVPG
jgi:hypothetical protein